MSNKNTLYEPFELKDLQLKNRMVLAPMTRSRAKQDGLVPSDMAPEYYRQRSTAGLIITEATQITPQGIGYILTPGIHSEEQVAGWKKVTQAVHEEGGKIFLQLWHVGRVSHPDFHDGELPVAPSAIKAKGQAFTFDGPKDMVTPRALETEEVKGIIEDYRIAAQNAKEAGFDGVEIHGANGYLPEQFLKNGSNKRTDEYGGSVENRAKFLLEVTQAAIDVFGANRVGVRLSPNGTFNDMSESDVEGTYSYVAKQLGDLQIAYLHLIEDAQDPAAGDDKEVREITQKLSHEFGGVLIVCGDYGKERAEHAVAHNETELVAFGRPYLANPDLPERYQKDAPLNEPDQSTFYGGGAEGYIDYPTLAEAETEA